MVSFCSSAKDESTEDKSISNIKDNRLETLIGQWEGYTSAPVFEYFYFALSGEGKGRLTKANLSTQFMRNKRFEFDSSDVVCDDLYCQFSFLADDDDAAYTL